jgi:hypothetical protein
MTTRTTLLRKESYLPTKTLPFDVVERQRTLVGTVEAPCQVHYLRTPGAVDDAAPQGFRSIDAVVTELEKDETAARELRDARARVAKDYYTPGIRPFTQLRLSAGLSQSKLGSLIGSSQAHIARLEAGHDVVVDTLERIAEALRVDAITLIQAYRQQRDAIAKSKP